MANTGNKIFLNLLKVSLVGNFPLDINDELCSLTNLPQATKPNVLGQPNYIAPVLDTAFCIVNIPCNEFLTSGGMGISDFYVTLENPLGGVLTFDFQAEGVPDKFEINHVLPGNVFVKKASSNVNAGSNSNDFDSVFGTPPTNLVPNNNVNSNNNFIGLNKGLPPTRYAEYVAATGINTLPFSANMQQRIWWVYTAQDYIDSKQVTVRITGDTGTAWTFKRLCLNS
jgi:hypothetical protein